LLAHVIKRERSWLFGHGEESVPSDVVRRYRAMIERRRTGEPVAYIRGFVEWFGVTLAVTPAVLVPRPETELLVERAAVLAHDAGARTAADVGTGSGAVAIGLALSMTDLYVTAIDISDAALAVAEQNVAACGVDDRIFLLQGDLLDPLREPPDLIAANLPYLSTAMWDEVDADVRHEPRISLVAGATGLELYDRLLRDMDCRGWVVPTVLEIDPRQEGAALHMVQTLLPEVPVTIERDYAGLARMVVIVP
jgi:release factor glutamine methyltransferase